MAPAQNRGCLSVVEEDGQLCSSAQNRGCLSEDAEDHMPLSSLLCGVRQRLPATPMLRKPQDGAVGTFLEAPLPGSSPPSWEHRKQGKASGCMKEDVLLTDLSPTPQFDVPLSFNGGFGGCGGCEFCSYVSHAVLDEEREYCCLECNEAFDLGAASALRGECPCGGEIDWAQAKHAKGSSGSTSEHGLSAATAAATSSLAPICDKVL
eukprot:4199005-Amphidinium_carterae.1